MKENIKNLTENLKDQRFIPLGEIAKIPLPVLTETLRIQGKKNKDKIWATLGWESDEPFSPKGDLEFSKTGNPDEGDYKNRKKKNKLTQDEIADIKAINPDLDVKRKKEVREYYINFDEVHFSLPDTFNPIDLPRLRLTVFLEPDEGALVYYHHSKKGDVFDPEAFSEYILHEKENNSNRDRLTYYFPVEPKHLLEPVDEERHLYRQTGQETGMSFIIKVLIFKQKKGTEKQLFSRSLKEINKSAKKEGNLLYELVGKDKYALLKFDPEKGATGEFDPVTDKGQILQGAKTLLLIHGTFVDTASSFEHLLSVHSGGKSVLQELLSKGKFEQILAFNHPTISENAEGNISWLATLLKNLDIHISKPLQIIATSRGALVAAYMASDSTINKYFPIGKIMTFSGGNGCGYFNLGQKISRALSVWKAASPGPAGKVISSIAQLSVQWFLEQPGCRMMTIGSKESTAILSASPVNSFTRYKTVVSDWHKCLVEQEPFFKRVGNTSLDAVIRIALGKEHDWVIGVEQQRRIPAGSGKLDESRRHSVHGRYLEAGYVRDENCKIIADPYQIIYDFFD